MNDLRLRIALQADDPSIEENLLYREWLVTNGLGGYASGTVAGAATRRYHGFLISALAAPLGRRMMLNHLMEWIRFPDGKSTLFGGEDLVATGLRIHGREFLREFRLEMGLPVWRYEFEDSVIEKRVFLPYRQNSVHIQYQLVSGKEPLRLKLRPSVHFRGHDQMVNEIHDLPYKITSQSRQYEITSATPGQPPLRIYLDGANSAFTLDDKEIELAFRLEENRGYESRGSLWSPGYFRADLNPNSVVTLVASTESWNLIRAMTPQDSYTTELDRRRRLLLEVDIPENDTTAAALVLAADQFVITPVGRVQDSARARSSGEEPRSVIAGYHWFTDWGRDTLISLEGLAICTGRVNEARWILHTFANAIRNGLIPNMFPEGENEGLYHTADATLWYFHSLHRYLAHSNDRTLLIELLPKLVDVVEHHLRGTLFNIGMDPADGLIRQGQEGYQLTWMDAKVGDWVVTPRRGKAVEINALWYNALRLMSKWVHEHSGESAARPYVELANQVGESFNRRFWYPDGGYLYDVIDTEQGGDDPALRPNQIFSVSLDYPVLAESRWKTVVDIVEKQLLTPYGLRSLAPGHPDYKSKYFGDLRSRDAAYHQGTVWGWLIGPFVDAWLRVHPNELEKARGFLTSFEDHLSRACVGSISEVFDAEFPYVPRACIAQAWSVAEVLRCWKKTTPAQNIGQNAAPGSTGHR